MTPAPPPRASTAKTRLSSAEPSLERDDHKEVVNDSPGKNETPDRDGFLPADTVVSGTASAEDRPPWEDAAEPKPEPSLMPEPQRALKAEPKPEQPSDVQAEVSKEQPKRDPLEPDYRMFEESQASESLPAGFWDEPLDDPGLHASGDRPDNANQLLGKVSEAERPRVERASADVGASPVTHTDGEVVSQHPLFPQLRSLFPGELLNWEEDEPSDGLLAEDDLEVAEEQDIVLQDDD